MENKSKLTTPIYEQEDRTILVQEKGDWVVYDGNGKELYRTWNEKEIRNEYPDAKRK